MFTDKLREGATGPVAKILFAVIIVSFAVAGVGSYLIPERNLDPVKVNDVKIPEYELENQVRLEKNRLERQFGRQYFEKQMASDPGFNSKFKASILERMINEEALAQHIADAGIEIPAELVRARIKAMPEFRVDGKFSQEQYEKVLRMAGYQSPEIFGEALRGDISKETFLKPVIEDQFALPGEIARVAGLLTEKRTYTRIDIDPAKFAGGEAVSDAEIAAFYEQNRDRYLQADRVKFSYIYLTVPDVKGDVHYTDEDLTAFYNLHSDLYTIPEKREISHILFTGDDAMEKAAAAKAELDAGADFAELAKKYSQDKTSADKGGKLPAFASGNQDLSIDRATFSLRNVGEISEPFKSDFGVHIVKLDAIIPAAAKPYEESKADVVERYVKEQSNEVFLDKRQIVADISYENPDSLDPAAKAANESDKDHPSDTVKIKTYESLASDAKDLAYPFSEQSVLDKIFDPELRQSGMNSDVIELGQTAFLVVHIEDYTPKAPKKLEEVRDLIRADIADARARGRAEEYVAGILAKLEKGESVSGEQASGKLKIAKPRSITRLDNKTDEAVAKNVFEMPRAADGGATFAKFDTAEGAPYILALTAVEEKTGPDASRDDFLSRQIATGKAKEDNYLMVDAIRSASKIDYNMSKEYLKRSRAGEEE